jgi:hypothetical protein
MEERLIFAIAILWLSMLMGNQSCDGVANYKTAVSAKSDGAFQCKKESDCVVVKADCCGCFQGGKAKAITKIFKNEYNQKLDANCKDTICMQVISRDQSCIKKAACYEERCVLN